MGGGGGYKVMAKAMKLPLFTVGLRACYKYEVNLTFVKENSGTKLE